MTPHRFLVILGALLLASLEARAQFIWTGHGATASFTLATNWQGGNVPPNNGTADVVLGLGIDRTLLLPGNYSLHSISFSEDSQFTITAAAPSTLTIGPAITATDDAGGNLWFAGNLTLNLSTAAVFDARLGTILVNGHITGSSNLSLISTSTGGGGAFVFNNTGTGNTYTGNTTVGDGVNAVIVAFWNSSPFGTGTITALNGSSFIAHGTQTVTNAFSFGTGTVSFRSWDAPLTLSGPVTLTGNTILAGALPQSFLAAPDNAGSIPRPGPLLRNPVIFSGTIGQSGGARSLTFNGGDIYILSGASSYTGGTTVNSGSLIYGTTASVPASGLILVNNGGYLGLAETTTGHFATLLASVDTVNSSGAIGIDTLPGNSTVTFADAINLTGYNASLRLGTATSAILTGAITPQGASYLFGNGGGTLYVQSSLTLAKGLSLTSTNPNQPLTVYLQGYNVYTGATTVGNGALIFDSSSAISPSTPTIVASGSATAVGASYVGYTDSTFSTPTSFLSKIGKASTWGIIGFDTHAGNSTVSIGNIDLTGFNDGVFIGTATSANLTGTFTASTLTNGNNAANTLRFTALGIGVLNVNSNITGSVGLMIGSPAGAGPYSSGTVNINGSNSYTGATTINVGNIAGLTVGVGNNSAFSTGAINIINTNSGIVGLQATSGGINLANAINLTETGGVNGPQLYFTGTTPFTLSGSITGDDSSSLNLYNPSALTVTLSGNNSAFLGGIFAYNGTLNLLNNLAAGIGNLYFGDAGPGGTVTFGGAATAPVIYGISGDVGNLIVPTGTALTFDVSDNATHENEFGGTISGSGSVTVSAPSASIAQTLYLYGNNTYTGGTTILNRGVLGLGQATSAGTGTVTLNAPSGGLYINSGVTFTNPLVYTAGVLGGFGTYAPSGTSNILIGSNRIVAPGVGGITRQSSVGTLTFNTDVTFANGGGYTWGVQDVTRSDGASLLSINGNLYITATSGGFDLQLLSFNSNNQLGIANMTLGTPYSLPILTATGTITGFNASAFSIDPTLFQGGAMNTAAFSLTQTGSTIYLNFTPVPEPSTYALLALGLSVFLIPRRRRT